MNLNLDDKKLINVVNECYDDIYLECLGRELGAFYASWGGINNQVEVVNLFFIAVKRFLQDKLIFAICPNDKCKKKTINGTEIWDATPDEVIKYIFSRLPKDLVNIDSVENINVEEYIKFWYEDCPKIIWIDRDNGEIYNE